MLDYLKIKLVKIAKKSEENGLCKCKSGNFSLRVGDYILITPSAVSREKMTKDDICVIDLAGNRIECKYGLKPSSEYLMHLEIYKKRNDINSIVHTHSKYATTFSVIKRDVPAIVTEASYIFEGDGIIRIAEYADPGSMELASNVSEKLKENNVCLLERHGAIAISNHGIDDAFLKAEYLEEVCEIYYNVLTISK